MSEGLTASAVSTTDFGIGAFLFLVVAILVYRLLRREPLDRIVRLGVFVERQRFESPPGEEEGEEGPTAPHEWPERR